MTFDQIIIDNSNSREAYSLKRSFSDKHMCIYETPPYLSNKEIKSLKLKPNFTIPIILKQSAQVSSKIFTVNLFSFFNYSKFF